MIDFTQKTLGELLSSADSTIRRNAIGILKQLQRTCVEVNNKNFEEVKRPPIKLRQVIGIGHQYPKRRRIIDTK